MLIRRGDVQTAVHHSDAIDADRLNQSVNGYAIDVVDPLQTLRIVMDETDGVAVDLTWGGVVPRGAGAAPPDASRRAGHAGRATLRPTGVVAGRDRHRRRAHRRRPERWIGTRDRSWGVRRSASPSPAGRPADPPFEGMWWLYVPLAFEDFAVVMIIQEEPNGFRTLNDCTRIMA